MISLTPALLGLVMLSTPEQAWQAMQNQQWEQAERAYEAVVDQNPYRSGHFLNLGYARMQQGDCGTAQEAFDRALELGGVRRSAAYYRARCAALAENLEQAVVWLEEATRLGFDRFEPMATDAAWSALWEDPQIQRMTMRLDSSASERTLGWREDIEYLDRLVRQRHANPFHSISQDNWRAAVHSLLDSINELNDNQLMIALMRLMASIGDGHSVLYPPFDGPRALSLLPVRPYLFSDGVYIQATDREHANLLGAQLLSVGETPVSAAMAKLAPLLPADNPMTTRWLMPLALRIPQLTPGVGTESRADSVNWTLRLRDGSTETIELHGQPVQADPLGRAIPDQWVDVAPGDDRPLWLRQPQTPYAFEPLPALNASYFRYNQVAESADESWDAFLGRLFAAIDAASDQRLIIDLRRNNGGNSLLNSALMHRLVGHPVAQQRGRLYVIIGRMTFSAAQNLANDLDRETSAIFVGEPTGSKPNFYGEDHLFRLPYSGLSGSISSRYWQGARFSEDDRIWIAPDLRAELSSDQYLRNIDPAMAVIAEYMAVQ